MNEFHCKSWGFLDFYIFAKSIKAAWFILRYIAGFSFPPPPTIISAMSAFPLENVKVMVALHGQKQLNKEIRSESKKKKKRAKQQ